MPRRAFGKEQSESFVSRLRSAIELRYSSPTELQRRLADAGQEALASTVRGWLNKSKRPAKRARAGPRAPKRVIAHKTPDLATLVDFCEFTGIRTDYLLFGAGKPYRDQSPEIGLLAEQFKAEATARVERRVQGVLSNAFQVSGSDLVALVEKALHDDLESALTWTRSLKPILEAQARELLAEAIRTIGPARDARRSDVRAHVQSQLPSAARTVAKQVLKLAPKTSTGRLISVVVPVRMSGGKYLQGFVDLSGDESSKLRNLVEGSRRALLGELRHLGVLADD